MSNEEQQNLRTAYDELCTSYRAIDDFRAKLLGLLPLITGGGLVVLTKDVAQVPPDAFLPIGCFGALVTLGLLAYEIYGIRKCHALIDAAQVLEKRMILPVPGQFRARPLSVLGFVNEPFAAAIIYPAVMAAWIYLATYSPPDSPVHQAVWVFFVGFAIVLGYSLWLRREEIKNFWLRREETKKRMKGIIKSWRDRRSAREPERAHSVDRSAAPTPRQPETTQTQNASGSAASPTGP